MSCDFDSIIYREKIARQKLCMIRIKCWFTVCIYSYFFLFLHIGLISLYLSVQRSVSQARVNERPCAYGCSAVVIIIPLVFGRTFAQLISVPGHAVTSQGFWIEPREVLYEILVHFPSVLDTHALFKRISAIRRKKVALGISTRTEIRKCPPDIYDSVTCRCSSPQRLK